MGIATRVHFDIRSDETSARDWRQIRERAKHPSFLDPEKYWIALPWMNDWEDKRHEGGIDFEMQDQAARILALCIAKQEPTHLLGIEKSGVYLSRDVHRHLEEILGRKVTYGEIEKLDGDSDKTPSFTARSYSSKEREIKGFIIPDFMFEPTKFSKRVVFVDDVAAEANVGLPAVVAVKNIPKTTVVFYGAYMSKDEQGGLKTIADEAGAPAQAIIRVASIRNGMELVSEDVAAMPVFPRDKANIGFDLSKVSSTNHSPWRFPNDDIR